MSEDHTRQQPTLFGNGDNQHRCVVCWGWYKGKEGSDLRIEGFQFFVSPGCWNRRESTALFIKTLDTLSKMEGPAAQKAFAGLRYLHEEMGLSAVKADLECGHVTVLTLGELFRYERLDEKLVRCTDCGRDREITNVKKGPNSRGGSMCVHCFNGEHVNCLHPKPFCECANPSRGGGEPHGGDQLAILVGLMATPATTQEHTNKLVAAIQEATPELRQQAADVLARRAAG